ncbi:hypothetical protein [Pseudomonas indica]|uniref:hypothetical protein n=1 Tax=Pseudomonas indica TaxID=137658 RepID=UPI003FD0FD65
MDALAFGYACFAGPALPSRHQEILSLGGYVAPVHGPLNEDVPLMNFATGEVLDRPYPRRSQARSALDFYDDYSIVPRVSPNGDLIHDLLAGASNVGNIPLNLGGALIGSFAEVMHSTGADKLLDPLMALPGFGVGAGATRGMLSGITALAAARAEARFAGALVPNNNSTRSLAGLVDNEAGIAGGIIREVEPGKFSSQIELALKSNDPLLEGQVGKALDQKGLLLDYQSKIRKGFTANGRPIGLGEIDAETPRFIIEIASGRKPGKIDQLRSLQNSTLLNPERKPVILFAPQVNKPQQIMAYENLGVKVINDLDQLFEFGAKNGGL